VPPLKKYPKSDASSGEYGPVKPGTTLSGVSRPAVEEGADLDDDSLPAADEIFKRLDNAENGQNREVQEKQRERVTMTVYQSGQKREFLL
jgi:hypothetical protein